MFCWRVPWSWFVSSVYSTLDMLQQSTTQSLLIFLKIDSSAAVCRGACLQCYDQIDPVQNNEYKVHEECKTSRWNPRYTNKIAFSALTVLDMDMTSEPWTCFGFFKLNNICANETKLIDFYEIDFIANLLRDNCKLFYTAYYWLKCIYLFLLKPILIKYCFLYKKCV